VSALTQDDVGRYLNRHFVSAFQKVGTFRIQNGNKQGGNVASYFCTPDGRVLHAIAGPVRGEAFLREARWANETYQLALMIPRTPAEMQAFFRKAHLDRLQAEHFVALHEDRLGDPSAVTPALLTELLESNVRLGINNAGKVHHHGLRDGCFGRGFGLVRGPGVRNNPARLGLAARSLFRAHRISNRSCSSPRLGPSHGVPDCARLPGLSARSLDPTRDRRL
jgi:hypothetical protein